MDTLKSIIGSGVYAEKETVVFEFNPLRSYLKHVDGQKKNHMMWWFINLVVQGNLVLWIPAWLVYYYQAPVILVGITVGSFFITLVTNMGGAGIRVTLTTFYASLLLHAIFIMVYVL